MLRVNNGSSPKVNPIKLQTTVYSFRGLDRGNGGHDKNRCGKIKDTNNKIEFEKVPFFMDLIGVVG